MLYTVKYKLKDQWFFRKIKNVKADATIPENGNRIIIQQDDTRYEFPISTTFIFSKERQTLIVNSIKEQAGK